MTYQGPIAEITVAQKLNQGTNPKTGCYRFRGSFFVYFFVQRTPSEDKQKSKNKNNILPKADRLCSLRKQKKFE